jgi:hypothetical protein
LARNAPLVRSPDLFIGCAYIEPYLERYSARVPEELGEDYRVLMPAREVAGGLLLDRIAAMVHRSDRVAVDVSVRNLNVWFEVGVAAAIGRPLLLLTEDTLSDIPQHLRGAFLATYSAQPSDVTAQCVEQLRAFLDSPSPPSLPVISGVPFTGRVAVVGERMAAQTIVTDLIALGHDAVAADPVAIRSLTEACEIAGSAESVVILAADDGWLDDDACAMLVTLGAAYALGRRTILVAPPGARIPSDCSDIAVRRTTAEAAAAVHAVLVRPQRRLPSVLSQRPHFKGVADRSVSSIIDETLQRRGNAALIAELGYGKTVVASQVAEQRRAVVWLTLPERLSLPDAIESLVAALDEYAPAFGWRALAMSRRLADEAMSVSEGVEPRLIGATLAADQVRVDEKVLLVIDDVQHATDAVAQLLVPLIAGSPQWLSILLVGRSIPDALIRQLDAMSVARWTGAELRCTVDDVGAIIRVACPTATDQQIAAALRATGGWPAAVGLVAETLARDPTLSANDIRASVAGDRGALYELFARQLLLRLGNDVRTDLLRAAIPLTLGPDECEELFGREYRLRGRELAAQFVFMEEGEAGVYRFHELFRSFLRQRFVEEIGRPELARVQSQLARWYAARRDTVSAYLLATDAQDWSTALDVIEPLAGGIANTGDASFLGQLLEPLPAEELRRRWRVREAWVRQLSLAEDPKAVVEAEGLAGAPDVPEDHRAYVELMAAEVAYSRGRIDRDAFIGRCRAIATGIHNSLDRTAIQASCLELMARGSAPQLPDDWKGLIEEARNLAALAEQGEVPSVVLLCRGLAGEILVRTAQSAMTYLSTKAMMPVGVPMTPIAVAETLATINDQLEAAQAFFDASLDDDTVNTRMARASNEVQLARGLAFLAFHRAILRRGIPDGVAAGYAQRAHDRALHAYSVYAESGIVRSSARALLMAAMAKNAIGDIATRDAYAVEIRRLSKEFTMDSVIRELDTLLEAGTPSEFHAKSEQPHFDTMSGTELDAYADHLIEMSGVDSHTASLARPVIRRILDDDAACDAANEATCRHLTLIYDLRHRQILGLPVELPRRQVICRLRGIQQLATSTDGAAVVGSFVSEICSTCDLADPGAPPRADALADLWRPLRERMILSGDTPGDDS